MISTVVPTRLIFYSISCAVSATLSECACSCGNTAITPAPPDYTEKRDSPPRGGVQYDDFVNPTLESAPATTPVSKRPEIDVHDVGTSKRRQMLANCHLPSGLSVETDPEME